MKIIQMSIVGQSIYVENLPDIISDCERYLAISCSFDSEWDGFVKTAVFKSGDIVKHVLLHPENELFYAGDNLYYVPSEVIRANGFTVAVIGTKEDVVLTTSVEFVAVGQSGRAEESAEKEKSEYLYAQVLSVLETIQRKMLSSKDVNLCIENNFLHLTAKGEAVGAGVQLPESPPWAKRIVYDKAALTNVMSVNVLTETDVNIQKRYIKIHITLLCGEYTTDDAGAPSFSPSLSEFRGIMYDSMESKYKLSENFADISETFQLTDGDVVFSMTLKDLETIAKDLLATFHRAISAYSSNGIAALEYIYTYEMDADVVTEEELNLIVEEFREMFEKQLHSFTTQYSEISYTKKAEVIENV